MTIEKETKADKYEKLWYGKAFFFMAGLASLLPINAMVTAFDYLQIKYPGHDVYFWFPVPIFVTMLLANIWTFLYS
jgi:hypothetical protein